MDAKLTATESKFHNMTLAFKLLTTINSLYGYSPEISASMIDGGIPI
jgi:hypothetical protein